MASDCHGGHAGSCAYIFECGADVFSFGHYGQIESSDFPNPASRVRAPEAFAFSMGTFLLCQYGRERFKGNHKTLR